MGDPARRVMQKLDIIDKAHDRAGEFGIEIIAVLSDDIGSLLFDQNCFDCAQISVQGRNAMSFISRVAGDAVRRFRARG